VDEREFQAVLRGIARNGREARQRTEARRQRAALRRRLEAMAPDVARLLGQGDQTMSEDKTGAEAPEATQTDAPTPAPQDPPEWAQRLLERVEAIDKRTAPQPPPNEARAGRRPPEGGYVQSQRELARLSVQDPERYRRLMADDTFDPTTLRPE
jgi:hypothetical protein